MTKVKKKAVLLEESERQMLRAVQVPLKHRMVKIPRNFMETKTIDGTKEAPGGHNDKKKKTYEISTVSTVTHNAENKPVVVLVHGCKGIYVQSFDDLAKNFQVHAIDLLGWGRSSRPKYNCGEDPKKAQEWWVESLEAWRIAMGIEKFTLVGHSMGGYVSASYALKYKSNLVKLVLISPIGLQGFKIATDYSPPFGHQLLLNSLWNLTPQRIVSMLPRKRMISFMGNLRSDLINAFPYPDKTVMYYFYNLAVQTPISGEVVFKKLAVPFKEWRLPLKDQLHTLGDLPVQLIYGENDWMDPNFSISEIKGKNLLPNAKVYILPDSGHHVYAQQHEDINELIANGEKSYPECRVKEFDLELDKNSGALKPRSISIA
ncbi:hypothetical protein G9A89_016749 [Geosiphon pyriformis]|nr:hypothetical protein G9A89_016749 [Geosiphon pyriformis]